MWSLSVAVAARAWRILVVFASKGLLSVLTSERRR